MRGMSLIALASVLCVCSTAQAGWPFHRHHRYYGDSPVRSYDLDRTLVRTIDVPRYYVYRDSSVLDRSLYDRTVEDYARMAARDEFERLEAQRSMYRSAEPRGLISEALISSLIEHFAKQLIGQFTSGIGQQPPVDPCAKVSPPSSPPNLGRSEPQQSILDPVEELSQRREALARDIETVRKQLQDDLKKLEAIQVPAPNSRPQ